VLPEPIRVLLELVEILRRALDEAGTRLAA
jgi:hypothetical protein